MSENFNFGRLEGLGHDLSIRDGYGEIRRNGILVEQRDDNDADMDLLMARIVGNALGNEETFPPGSALEVVGGGYEAYNSVSVFGADVAMRGKNESGFQGLHYLPGQAVQGGAGNFVARLSCSSSESWIDRSDGLVDYASDGSFSPLSNSGSLPSPPRSYQLSSESVRSQRDFMGKKALYDCQVVLLEAQKLRSDTAVAYGLRANGDHRDFEVAFEPQAFMMQDLQMLLVFNMHQFEKLNELVKRLEERSIRPEQRVASHIWSQMDPVNRSSLSRDAASPSSSLFVFPYQQNPLNDTVDCPSFMRGWKASTTRILGIFRRLNAMSDLTQLEPRDFNNVLKCLGKLREDIVAAQISFRTKYPIGANGLSGGVSSGNSVLRQENHRLTMTPALALPYRAEDEFPSFSLRFPPSRKQRGTPKYSKTPGYMRH